MELFNVDPKVCIFKKKLNQFFVHKNVKKWASKVAHNRPRPFYFTVQPSPQPRAQNQFFISWNLRTRHLFSSLSTCPTSLTLSTLQKLTFFDYLPTSPCKRSLWTTPNVTIQLTMANCPHLPRLVKTYDSRIHKEVMKALKRISLLIEESTLKVRFTHSMGTLFFCL